MNILKFSAIYAFFVMIAPAEGEKNLAVAPPPSYNLPPLLTTDMSYNVEKGVWADKDNPAGEISEGSYSRQHMGTTVINNIPLTLMREEYRIIDPVSSEANTTATTFYIAGNGVIWREERPDGTYCDLNDTALPMDNLAEAGDEAPSWPITGVRTEVVMIWGGGCSPLVHMMIPSPWRLSLSCTKTTPSTISSVNDLI